MMWLILFGFREGAVEIEVSPVINRHTPKMDTGFTAPTFVISIPGLSNYLT